MVKINKNHNIIGAIIIGIFLINGCNNSNNSSADLRFTYIGDLHYKIPDYTISEYFVSQVSEELVQLIPKSEFAILSGDFFHGQKGTDIEAEAAFSFKDFSENIGMPFFIAKGNHDLRGPYEKNSLPIFSNELGRSITKSYYSFDKANCHFIILDCTDNDLTEQMVWLEQDLKDAASHSEIKHIFVVGHYPLWVVARAGFTRPEYSNIVAELLAKYEVDAYFCGHTHNKTTTVKKVNGTKLTQIMGAAIVEEGRLFNLAPFLNHVRATPENSRQPGLLPLEEVHGIFIEPSELVYYWGYQEGSTSSYSIITVKGGTVQVDYHILGKGIVRSYKWNKPGELVNLKEPEKVETEKLTDENFSDIEKAWLYAGAWTKQETVTTPFSINGVDAGNITISRKAVAYSPFWNKIELPLSKTVISVLKKDNTVRIINPAKCEFGLAHVFILIRFCDGRYAKSTISPFVLSSFEPTEKVNNFPDEKFVRSVDKGQDLEEVTLNFDGFLQR